MSWAVPKKLHLLLVLQISERDRHLLEYRTGTEIKLSPLHCVFHMGKLNVHERWTQTRHSSQPESELHLIYFQLV